MENSENNTNQATTEQSTAQENVAVETNVEKTQTEAESNNNNTTTAEKMEVEHKEGEKEETEAKEEKPTPKKRGRKPKSASAAATTEAAKPELLRSNSIQTRSKSLKRTHDKVEADPNLKAAHDALEPLAKKARTTRGAVKVANNNIEASDALSEEEKEQLTMIYNLCDIDK